eukprot:snap_masked-scaffold_6-processed-gene-19.38-mRNA-1 protein AED:1.00 eAED:1.00 QI:0/0/0/0/1/1/2/0/89
MKIPIFQLVLVEETVLNCILAKQQQLKLPYKSQSLRISKSRINKIYQDPIQIDTAPGLLRFQLLAMFLIDIDCFQSPSTLAALLWEYFF